MRIIHKTGICAVAAIAIMTVMAGCKGLTDVPDPTTIVDPGVVKTQDGAIGLYRSALSDFAAIYAGGNTASSSPSIVMADALGGDQLVTNSNGPSLLFMLRYVDQALAPAIGYGDVLQPYSDMHKVRLNIGEAIGALSKYAPTAPVSFRGELYAMRGYLYIYFSELYCSGVPFSYAIYGGDIVLTKGETTSEMLQHAIAQFDTAVTFSGDSVRIRQLATLGKARALLNLGRFVEAGAAASVSNVPTGFVYNMTYSASNFPNLFAYATAANAFYIDVSITSRAGSNGLPYLDAPDSRLATVPAAGYFPGPIPAKYSTGSSPVAVGNGIEARLIEAEAALHAGDIPGWRDGLNALRASASIPALGTDSTTTASSALREDVMFRERAYWLFVTGHRMGDLRRMIRQYGRPSGSVLTIGVFPQGLSNYPFSAASNFEPPQSERNGNPNYTGCYNRDA